MSEEACPLPSQPTRTEEEAIRHMLGMKRIAVVGMSDDSSRPSHYVSAYLMERGYEIVPVNPTIPSVRGLRSHGSLAEIEQPVDLVLVFRRSAQCPGVAEEAAKIHAKGLWLQSGIRSPESRRIAEEAGMEYVEDRCMMMERMRHREG